MFRHLKSYFLINYSLLYNYCTSSLNKCWKCNSKILLNNFLCESCKTILPFNSKINYFAYFGLNKQFDINENELKKKFLKFQSFVHPDKFATNSQTEQKLSQQHSSYLNQAYKVLNDPLSRADYLLQDYEKDNLVEEKIDSNFAIHFMEFNEEIEAANNIEKLNEYLIKINSEINEVLLEMKELFLQKNLKEAKHLLDKLRYMKRTQKLIKLKLGINEIE